MELRHLRYFIKAAEFSNFTKAAEALYVSQPTLSVQIHQLEEELGTELFARVGRNVRLTEAGRVFLNRARQAVKELEDGAEEVDAINGLIRGSLCVASLPLYGSRLMPGWLSLFSTRYPNVQLSVRAGTSDDIEAGIMSGTIDIGVGSLPVQHVETNYRQLFEDEIVLIASRDHPVASAKSLKPKDLNGLSFAVPSERISASHKMAPYFESQGLQPKLDMTYDDGHGLIELVRMGRFVTTLPRRAVRDSGDLVFLSLPGPGLWITIGAMWSHLSPAGEAFLELVTEETKKCPTSIS